jgi:hypothetical protein
VSALPTVAQPSVVGAIDDHVAALAVIALENQIADLDLAGDFHSQREEHRAVEVLRRFYHGCFAQ